MKEKKRKENKKYFVFLQNEQTIFFHSAKKNSARRKFEKTFSIQRHPQDVRSTDVRNQNQLDTYALCAQYDKMQKSKKRRMMKFKI